MPPVQYLTLVTSGGTPVRLANQNGAAYPTTGAGSLVFDHSPTLYDPTIVGATWEGPQTIEGDFTVTEDLFVGEDIILSGATSGTTHLRAAAVASGTLTMPAATDVLLGRNTTDTLTNKTLSGLSNTFTDISLATAVTGTLPLANGGTGVIGFGSVVPKTSGYVLVAADSYMDFDNNGAVAQVIFTLPASVVGLAYGFAVMEAQNLVIDAPAGVTIYLGEIATSVGGTLTSNSVGSYVFLKCRSSTEWLAQSSMGSWTPA